MDADALPISQQCMLSLSIFAIVTIISIHSHWPSSSSNSEMLTRSVNENISHIAIAIASCNTNPKRWAVTL